MKRLCLSAVLGLASVTVFASQALAQTVLPGGGPGVPTETGGAPGAIAKTGTNISFGLIIVAALVVLGLVTLVAGYRRRVSASK